MTDFFDELDVKSEMTDEGQAQVVKLSNVAVELEEEIKALEASLKERREKHRQVIEQDIPDLMTEYGLVELTLDSGAKISVKDDIRASIIKDNSEAAFGWLENQGHGALIKHEVVCSFGKGEDTKAKEAVEQLTSLGFNPEDKKQVHWQTLNAFVREQLEKGTAFPEELFSVYQGRKAVIKLPK